MRKKWPKPKTDKESAQFIETADLTDYDLSALAPAQFEFSGKDSRVNMRLPGTLLAAVKVAAKRAGMPYQRFIRRALEDALSR